MQTQPSRNATGLVKVRISPGSIAFLVVWLAFSYLLLFIQLPSNEPGLVLSARAYAITQGYAIGIWVWWSSRQPLYVTWWGGFFVLSLSWIGLATRIFFSLPHQPWLAERLPPLPLLACTLVFHLGFWWSLRVWLEAICGQHHRCVILLGSLIWLLMLSNLLWIHYLPLWFPTVGSSLVSLMLYFNPLVLIACCFPDYDYLRGLFFYEVYAITADLGPFQYPKLHLAAIGYGSFISIALFWKQWTRWYGKKQTTKD